MNRKLLLNPASMLLCGLIAGAASRLFDIYDVGVKSLIAP